MYKFYNVQLKNFFGFVEGIRKKYFCLYQYYKLISCWFSLLFMLLAMLIKRFY